MAANQDDIAFRSQEYASQVNRDVEPARQRMQNATEGFAQSVGQGVQMFQQGRQDQARNALAQRELEQRQQQIAMERTRDAGALALQQTRQKQAEYELFFTQQIHNTKAIEAQRRLITTQADIADLQKRKLEQDLHGAWPKGITVEEMDYMVSKGRKWDFRTRDWMDATPEEMAAAEKRSTSGIAQRRLEYQEQAEARKAEQGEANIERRGLESELEAVLDEIEHADRLPKAEKDKKKAELTEELSGIRKRLKKLRRAKDNEGEEEAAAESQPQTTTGGEFYRDMLRSIPKAGK